MFSQLMTLHLPSYLTTECMVNREFLAPAQPVKWEGVGSINNLSYQDTGVTVWKAYDIGKGKTILQTQLQGMDKTFLLTYRSSCWTLS